MRELFEFGLMQTDPNFANYLYDAARERITLLDFGATQAVDAELAEVLRDMARGLRDRDRPRLQETARRVGFIGERDTAAHVEGVIDLMLLSSEPLRHPGPYDFGKSDLFARVYTSGRDK